MKRTKNVTDLICKLEYIIGSQTYNPHSYDGYTGIEGKEYRYPVTYYKQPNEKKAYKTKMEVLDIPFSQIYTMKYVAGANHIFIGQGIAMCLQFIEKRYGIDFDELEANYKKSKKKK